MNLHRLYRLHTVFGVALFATAAATGLPQVVEFEDTEALAALEDRSDSPIKVEGLTLSFLNGAVGGVVSRNTEGYKGTSGSGITGNGDQAVVMRIGTEGVVQFAFDTPVNSEGFGFEHAGVGDDEKQYRLVFSLQGEALHEATLTGPVPGKGQTFAVEPGTAFRFDSLRIVKSSRHDTDWSIDRITFQESPQ